MTTIDAESLPPLEGTPNQVAYATNLRRHNVTGTAHLAPIMDRVMDGVPKIYDTPTMRRIVADVVRRQTSAAWWIERNIVTRGHVLGGRDTRGAATDTELREIYNSRVDEPATARAQAWTRNVLRVNLDA
jgi:hypothetical protein